MPVVSVNNLPLYERAIFGYDGTNYRIVSVNTSGQLVLALASGTVIQANSYGWISGAQQRDPLRIGLSGVIRRLWSNTNLAVGSNNVDDTAVPAGEYWVITGFSMVYQGTVPTDIRFSIVSGATGYELDGQAAPANNIFYGIQGQFVLAPGENLRAVVNGATAADQLHARATGFRVDIDQ